MNWDKIHQHLREAYEEAELLSCGGFKFRVSDPHTDIDLRSVLLHGRVGALTKTGRHK